MSCQVLALVKMLSVHDRFSCWTSDNLTYVFRMPPDMDWSLGNEYLATASWDGSIRLWNSSRYNPHLLGVTSLPFFSLLFLLYIVPQDVFSAPVFFVSFAAHDVLPFSLCIWTCDPFHDMYN